MRELNEIFHSGELDAQSRFNNNKSWDAHSISRLNKMFKQTIDDETAYFIEGQKYFFIATSNKKGECDCSFRGTELDSNGHLLQSVFIKNPSTLIFPDYSGNNLYNSLGNIIVNPNIGMLFIDFTSALRLRLNGSAKIISNTDTYQHIWPKSLRYIEVNVEQVYFNCSKRIKESFNLAPNQ